MQQEALSTCVCARPAESWGKTAVGFCQGPRGRTEGGERHVNLQSAETTALNWKDCVNLSDLTEDELADLAMQGGEIEIEGAELDHYLVITPKGQLAVRAALASEIRSAVAAGDVRRSGTLKQVLLRFMQIYAARTT